MNMKLGQIITDKRKKANLTQQDLADKLGVSNTAISKWENDINYPDISLIQPLCKILKIDIIKLLGIEEKPKQNIYKYLTIILTIIILILSVSISIVSKEKPTIDVLKLLSNDQSYTVDGLIIKKEDNNNLLIYNFINNDNSIGTTDEKTIKRINILINKKTKYVFSDTNDLLNKINKKMINFKGTINDINLEITYISKTKQEQTETIPLNVEVFD